MVLGLAMCTTMAFAQTSISRHDMPRSREMNVNLSEAKPMQDIDYKASIFAKDARYDTLMVFTFSEAQWGQMTAGTLTNGAHIMVDGVDSTLATGSGAHTVNVNANPWAQWRRYSDTTAFINNFTNDYTNGVHQYLGGNNFYRAILNRIGVSNQTDTLLNKPNDGFVCIAYDYFQDDNGVGDVNAYIQLPTVDRTGATGHLVMVAVNQAYRSFYDKCFIDYQIGNTWYAREINVNGIDCAVNEWGPSKVRYIMPHNLKDVASIKLRIRASAQKYAAYGYGWFLDNVAVVNMLEHTSWTFNTVAPFDGLYGMIPQGMTIPVTFGVHGVNNNINDINNATLTLENAPLNGSFSNVITSDNFNLTAGDIFKNYKLYINERGFMDTAYTFDYGTHSFLGNFENYGATTLSGNYQGRGLNTSTPGPNVYRIKANAGTLSTLIDSVLYTVSSYEEFDDDNYVNGYRWGRDNGVIAAGTSFKLAYTNTGYITQTDNNSHSAMRNYMVHVRYVSGSEIPTDQNGEPWVLLGYEMIPSTDGNNGAAEDAILPIMTEEVYFEEDGENYISFSDLPTGLSAEPIDIPAASLSALPDTGYVMPGEAYSAINVRFPDPPALKPNTAYRFGYRLLEEVEFHVATQSYSYLNGNGSYTSYASNPETAPYYYQNMPFMPYDVMVYDANGQNSQGSHWLLGWYSDNYPLIRPIVGPAPQLERVAIGANCESNVGDTLGISVTRGTDNLCQDNVMAAVGTDQLIEILPLGDHSVIVEGSIKVNGQPVDVYDGSDNFQPSNPWWLYEGEYNVTNSRGDVLLQRKYYQLQFSEIAQNANGYEITAEVEWVGHSGVGIDPVAPEATLVLAPNPATSTVKLHVEGVSGMVNCSIIDMSGRVVYNANVNAEAETTINVSSLPAGAYFVRVTNDTFSKIEKLIVK